LVTDHWKDQTATLLTNESIKEITRLVKAGELEQALQIGYGKIQYKSAKPIAKTVIPSTRYEGFVF